MLKEELDSIVKYCYDRCHSLGTINFATNGLLPEKTARFFEEIAGYCRHIEIFATVSIDGLGEEHDNIRQVEGAFEKSSRCFDLLERVAGKYRNFHVRYQITVSRFNLDSVISTFDYVSGFNSPVVTFAHETGYFHNVGGHTDIREDKEKAYRVADYIFKHYRVRQFHDIIPKCYLKLATGFVRTGYAPLPCDAGFSTTSFDPSGEVLPCPHLFKSAGNLRDVNYDVEKILRSRRAAEIREEIKACRSCWQNCEAYPTIIQNPLKLLRICMGM